MLTVAYVLLYRTPVRMTRNSTAIIAPTHLLPFVCTYAYCSSYRYELGQPRCCQNGRLATPRSILRNWMWFFDTVLIMHQPTNGNQALFLCFLFERYDRYNDPEKYKSDRNLSEKKITKEGSLSVCLHMRYKYEVKISDRNSQNWAGHRRKNSIFRNYLSYVWVFVFGHISWWVANWVMKLISVFSLGLQLLIALHQFSPWSGTTILLRI